MASQRRRNTPPHVNLPARLYLHVEAELTVAARLLAAADEPAQSAADALARLHAIRATRGIFDRVEGLLVAWLVEDAQTAHALVAEAVGMDPSNIGRKARRHLDDLRELG